MADPNISVKISDLPGSGAMADTDVLPLARAGANYKVTGAQIKTYAATPAPAGSNTQVQFNDGGVLGAHSGLTYNKATSTLTVANLTGKASSVTPAGSNTQVQVNDGGVLAGFAWLIINKASQLLQSTIIKATSYFSGCVAGVVTISNGDTTPSVARTQALKYTSDANLTITNFDDGIEGQEVTIINLASSYYSLTITRDNLYVPGTGNIVLAASSTLKIQKFGIYWYVTAGPNVNH